MKSVMTHQFNRIPSVSVERSVFDRSHGIKTTFDAGYLVPIYVDEAMPGDTFNLRMSGFARMATPIKAPMDNMFMETFFFAVPYRLVWSNWQRFMGEKDNPGDSTVYNVPQMTGPGAPGILVGSLSDYFGIPTGVANLTFDSLFHRGYNIIFREWFRDQNLQDSPVVDVDDGPDTYSDYVLLRRCKKMDYFTGALPWPQKGSSVSLPLGTTAPVVGNNTSVYLHTATAASDRYLKQVGGNVTVYYDSNPPADNPARFGKIADLTATGLVTDLSTATAATINALRQAFQLQRLYERDARGGTRYIEIVKSHFGVDSADLRPTRPIYLGGGSSLINVHSVVQTNDTSLGETPQGNIAGFGTASFVGHGFTKSFTEHCLIIGLINVRADLTYQQGLDRMFSRRTRFDFYWPSLAHLGEQEILNKEIYCDGSGNDSGVFGYQERYAEYRYKPSKITGMFRSTYASTLDIWHLAQEYGSLPGLNSAFIQDDPPIDRVIAVPTEPHFLFDGYFNLKCARPMPVYSVPGFIDHF